MIGELKPYAEYKDSGLPWLGQVPVRWSLLRAKCLFREVDERSTTGKEELLSVSHITGVTPRRQKNVTMFMAESNVGHKVCRPGDLVINTLWAWMAALGVTRHLGIVSPAYGVYRPIEGGGILPAYADFLLRTPLYAAEYQRRSTGVNSARLRLYPEQFLRMPVLVPPLEEQAAIVRFLDWANGRLERAIRAKRKVIALLKEQMQIAVQRAVTKGLRPQVSFKSAGLSWLSEVPLHWAVISLRMRYTVDLGKMLDAKRVTGRHSIPYLRNRDVQWDRVLVDDLPTMDIAPSEFERYTVKRGDLLVCEGGQVGRCAFWDEPVPLCGYQKALHRVRAIDNARDYPRFFFYQLQLVAGLGVFTADGNENTIAHLTNEKLRRHRFVFPPFDEQREIADTLDVELSGLNVAVARIEREIALLREYRSRLIADIVTGRFDARETAARLPDDGAIGGESDPGDKVDDAELTDEEATEA
ncbi:MAG: restriction endonuclease subunit S [Burkholderiaceae bacterium]